MKVVKNHILERGEKKPILLDYFTSSKSNDQPIIIFAHGYKGFKDWGAWNLMAQTYANAGFCFVKFNFSHNGGTMENPIDFPDLEAFGNNNYSKELDDLNTVIDWTQTHLKQIANTNEIYLIGHSRAGGIVSICAAQNKLVKKVVTLAGVSDYESRFPKDNTFDKWKESGVYHVKNGRTHQEMPHYFQFFEDFEKNKEMLTIKNSVENLKIPHLIVHGKNDIVVSFNEALQLHQWNPRAELQSIHNANHTFGASHPWNHDILPKDLRQTTQCVINFLN
ncbi:MAG: alpha/beta hydrolase family protein [Nonlabens sp.]|uniref:alpha/beta hydrolase family protein n=1 Tax=Nonlabens sp. TaxID=1888209 RepID=UPI003EF91672